MKGLEFVRDELPKGDEDFSLRKIFKFKPEFGKGLETAIVLELFDCGICLLSYFDSEKQSKGRDKYKERSDVSSGHARAILQSCLEAYYSLEGDYALMFSAANDPNKVEETNARFRVYKIFLSRYFKDFQQHEHRECSVLNTLIVYPQNFDKKDSAEQFYLGFERRVKSNLEKEVTKEFNPLDRLPEEFNYALVTDSQIVNLKHKK
jgi:hypothetical protein